MTVNQLGNETTTVFAEGAEFVMERVFDAPRELVWQALTDPERIPRWWGKRHTTMTVEEMDVRVGGRWRWVAHTPDGDAPFSGEYLEIEPPGRLRSNGAASSVTVPGPSAKRAMMARRVGSARAAKIALR